MAAVIVNSIQEQQTQIASLSGQLALLHTEGSCVTGDTMLPIKRKKKKRRKSQEFSGDGDTDDEESNDEFDYLLCRIDEIMPGDEVLSLNEFTEALEYHRINKLMDMGMQEVYEIVTKSGRTIRTTSNHPYLTLIENNKNVDYSPLTNIENFPKIKS